MDAAFPRRRMVKSCCGCCSLKKGCLFIGTFNLIVLGAYIITVEWTSLTYSPYDFGAVVWVLISLCVNANFIYGVQNENLRCIKLWLWFYLVMLGALVVVAVRMLTLEEYEDIIIPAMNSLILIFFLIVGHSYMVEIVLKREVIIPVIDEPRADVQEAAACLPHQYNVNISESQEQKYIFPESSNMSNSGQPSYSASVAPCPPNCPPYAPYSYMNNNLPFNDNPPSYDEACAASAMNKTNNR